jgi:hypothetical protein
MVQKSFKKANSRNRWYPFCTHCRVGKRRTVGKSLYTGPVKGLYNCVQPVVKNCYLWFFFSSKIKFMTESEFGFSEAQNRKANTGWWYLFYTFSGVYDTYYTLAYVGPVYYVQKVG